MKTTLLSILSLIVSSTLIGQNINIPDANFKAYLVGEPSINTNADSEIQIAEAQAYTGTINCGNMSISDMTGIEEFTSINNLYCHQNQLTSLDLSSNTALTYVNCRDNGNQFTSITFGTNPNLTNIVAYNNGFTSFDVTGLSALESLDCKHNQISTLDVSNNVNLDYLECSYNLFTTNLDLSNNTNLTQLYCISTQLTALDLSSNLNLIHVECHNNQLSSLNLGNNTNLEYLSCSNSGLTALDVSNNTGLLNLSCYNNQLTSLDVSNNTLLQGLYCHYNNQVGSLDVSSNTNLIELHCSNIGLSSIDVSNCANLTQLYCKNNQIVSIDVSNNTNLEDLSCSQNQLTTLNMANGNNANISFFEADDNPNLTCIQVDDSTYSADNWTSIDSTASYSENCGGSAATVKEEQLKFSVFPNPVDHILNIESNEKVMETTIYTPEGKECINLKNQKTINTSELESGVYIISVKINNQDITRKFVKK